MTEVRRISGRSDHRSASPRRREVGGGALPGRERPLAGIAARQHGVIAAPQLLELGYSRTEIGARVRRGLLHRLHAGVYAVGHPGIDRHGRWMAAALAAGPEALLSHRDCAALAEVVDYTGGEVEVTLPGLGSRSLPGIRIHRTRRLEPGERTTIRGIRRLRSSA